MNVKYWYISFPQIDVLDVSSPKVLKLEALDAISNL